MVFGQINALTCVVQSCTTRQKTSDLSGEKVNKPSRFDATNLLIKRLLLHRSATVQPLFGLWVCTAWRRSTRDSPSSEQH